MNIKAYMKLKHILSLLLLKTYIFPPYFCPEDKAGEIYLCYYSIRCPHLEDFPHFLFLKAIICLILVSSVLETMVIKTNEE